MTAMNKTPRDSVTKVSAPRAYLQKNTSNDGEVWFYGSVLTRFGYVRVHAEPAFTVLAVVHDGYEVFRSVQRAYTQRGLATLANRFAEEICG
jgi:hypothetical protein